MVLYYRYNRFTDSPPYGSLFSVMFMLHYSEMKIRRETLKLLNELTPDNKTIIEQRFFTHLYTNVKSDEDTHEVVSTIFEKACDEKTFSNLYANLCYYVNQQLKLVVEEEINATGSSEKQQLK